MTDVKTQAAKLKTLAKIFKSVSAQDLADIEIIDNATEGGASADVIPDLLTGPMIGAHGADAGRQESRGLQPTPQEGLSKDYQEVAAKLQDTMKAVTALTKSHRALLALISKAADADGDEDEEKSNKDEDEVGKSLRKARIALRKAESDEEDDKEAFEKAESVLKSADLAITKAEDDADSDEDEKKVEKARTEFKSLRKSLKDIKAARVAKAAPVAVEAPAATQKAEEIEAAALENFAKGQGVTVADMIAAIKVTKSETPLVAPPIFSKSNGVAPIALAMKASEAFDTGRISSAEHLKAESIINRISAVQAGLIEPTGLQAEIDGLPTNLRDVFSR